LLEEGEDRVDHGTGDGSAPNVGEDALPVGERRLHCTVIVFIDGVCSVVGFPAAEVGGCGLDYKLIEG
jgi:hypothetical protein